MPKKYLNLLLISIAFVVWMVVFYQFVFDYNKEGDFPNINNKSESIIAEENKENLEQYLLKSAIDPFITPYNYSAAKLKKTKPPGKFQNLHSLKLLGILSDKESPMAIVGFPDSSIQFVLEKQKIDKFTILDISDNTVKYKYENITKIVKLD